VTHAANKRPNMERSRKFIFDSFGFE
jgi:hypothetical protein